MLKFNDYFILECSWFTIFCWAPLVAQTLKNLPAMRETWVWSLGWENPLEEGMAWQPIPVFLPGESLWTKEPGRLQATGSQRVRHDWVAKHTQNTVDLQYSVSFRCTAKWFSFICTYPFFFRFFSHKGNYRVLSRVPCATQ